MSVVLVGFDAADISRVERLIDAGRMPNLAALRAAGQQGLLRAHLHQFEAMTWPRWMESRNVSRRYFPKIWQPDSMTFALARECWQPRTAFWAHVAAAGGRVAVFDVPHSVLPAGGDAAVMVKDWQTATIGTRASAPAGLWNEIGRRFGAPVVGPELYGPRSAAYYLDLHTQLLAATEQAGAIGQWLLRREPWDLFVLVLGATHRGGHYLWDRSQIAAGALSTAEEQRLDNALDDIYVASDAALGRVLEAAPPGARCLAFATYGMKANTGWVYHFHEMLDRIERGPDGSGSSLTLLGRLRDSLPRHWVMKGSNLLPAAVRSHLMRLLTSRLRNWSNTRYLAVPSEPEGFIRLNLVGRERDGIVPPGPEQHALIERLRADLASFRDLDTGLPIVEQITEVDDLVPDRIAERYWLPDLVVAWTNAISAQASRGVRSPAIGEVRWQPGAPYVSGRSGTHHGTGWYAAAGAGIVPCAVDEVRDPIDIGPTVLRWLGVTPPDDLDGRAIESLLAQRAAFEPPRSAGEVRRRA